MDIRKPLFLLKQLYYYLTCRTKVASLPVVTMNWWPACSKTGSGVTPDCLFLDFPWRMPGYWHFRCASNCCSHRGKILVSATSKTNHHKLNIRENVGAVEILISTKVIQYTYCNVHQFSLIVGANLYNSWTRDDLITLPRRFRRTN